MKRIWEVVKDRFRDIPTTIIGAIIIALALYGFFQLGQSIAATIEYLLVGIGFILTPESARDILFKKMDDFKEESNND